MNPQNEPNQLIELSSEVFAITGPTNIGVIVEKQGEVNNIYLIDSGNSSDDAKTIYTILENHFSPFELKAIINTHSHCDHCGGNSFLVKKTNCEVWATKDEKGSIETPLLQSAVSTGGFPLPEFKSSFYMAESSEVTRIVKDNEVFELSNGIRIELIPLEGHYLDMVGVLCSTSNSEKAIAFFAADGIFGRTMLGKYWMPYLFEIGKFKDSLQKIGNIKSNYYIPSHGDICDDISALVEFNLISTVSNETCILQILETPHTMEELLKEFADRNNIPLRLSQFVLVGSTIRSYLSYLYSEEKIKWCFRQNRMLWSKI